MKTPNIILLIVLVLSLLEIGLNDAYYFAGGSAMIIIFYFAKQLIDLTTYKKKK